MTDPDQSPPAPAGTDYSLSEAAAQALNSLAAIAPGLTDAELRTCLYLATVQNPHTRTARASSRQIAAATRLARDSVQRALDSLARRCLIATRQGSATSPACHLLNWTQTTAFRGGPTIRPPVQPELPGVARPSGHPSQPLIDISMGSMDSLIDRVLTARPKQFERSQLDAVRGYAYKWLILQRGQHNAHAPDDFTVAQIITAAGGIARAVDWIRDNLQDRQAESCQYLVSMLLQRLHGITPAETKARRAQLKARKATQATPDPETTQDEAYTEELVRTANLKVKNL
jgi:hypothetical protein